MSDDSSTSKISSNSKPRFCSQCGKPLTPGAKFCFNCGAPVADIPTKSETNSNKSIDSKIVDISDVVEKTSSGESISTKEIDLSPRINHSSADTIKDSDASSTDPIKSDSLKSEHNDDIWKDVFTEKKTEKSKQELICKG